MCVISKLPALMGLCTYSARLREEVLWETLAQSEALLPVSWPLAHLGRPIRGRTLESGDWSSERLTVFRGGWKQKLMRLSSVPASCLGPWKTLHRSDGREKSSLHAAEATSEWSCDRGVEVYRQSELRLHLHWPKVSSYDLPVTPLLIARVNYLNKGSSVRVFPLSALHMVAHNNTCAIQ